MRLDEVGAEDEDDELVDALIVSKLLLGIETKAPLVGTFIFSLEMFVSISIAGASLFVSWSIRQLQVINMLLVSLKNKQRVIFFTRIGAVACGNHVVDVGIGRMDVKGGWRLLTVTCRLIFVFLSAVRLKDVKIML